MPKKNKVLEVERHVTADEIKNTEVAILKNVEYIAPGTLVAYDAFEHDGVLYRPGDVFTPPAGWEVDAAFDEFRAIQRKNGADVGTAFNVPGEILDKKTNERNYYRQILPIKEA